jgi:hypothetical protein
VLSFVLKGYETEEVGRALNEEGIAVRSGHHCAQPILRRFGLEATAAVARVLQHVRRSGRDGVGHSASVRAKRLEGAALTCWQRVVIDAMTAIHARWSGPLLPLQGRS